MTAFLHLIVPRSRFRLLAGAAISYLHVQYRHGAALFCRHCGIKSFYVPRSNPDGYSVNARCLERRHDSGMNVGLFDDTTGVRGIRRRPRQASLAGACRFEARNNQVSTTVSGLSEMLSMP